MASATVACQVSSAAAGRAEEGDRRATDPPPRELGDAAGYAVVSLSMVKASTPHAEVNPSLLSSPL